MKQYYGWFKYCPGPGKINYFSPRAMRRIGNPWQLPFKEFVKLLMFYFLHRCALGVVLDVARHVYRWPNDSRPRPKGKLLVVIPQAPARRRNKSMKPEPEVMYICTEKERRVFPHFEQLQENYGKVLELEEEAYYAYEYPPDFHFGDWSWSPYR